MACVYNYYYNNYIAPEGATSMFNGRFFAVMQFTGTSGTLIGSLILSLFDNRNVYYIYNM